MSWTIKGDPTVTPTTVSGVVHGLDDTARLFADLTISAASVQFQALATDTLKWTATTTNAKCAGTIVPSIGQVVELFSGSTRKFKGHAIAPRAGMKALQVEVVGPWWWMQEIQLTGYRVDDSSTTQERVQFEFAAGPLDQMLKDLIDRMIALGVPIIRGAVASMGSVTKRTLNNMSCANALTALLSLCADAVPYFDYSGTVPELKIARRNGSGAMATLDFTIGTDAITLEGEGLRARQDLKVSWFRVNFMTRDGTTKRAKYGKQTSAGSRTPGEWVMVTTSGPEIVQTLTADDADSVTLQTYDSIATSALAVVRDSALAQIAKNFGGVPGSVGSSVTTYTGITDSGPTSSAYQVAGTYYFPTVTAQRASDGAYYQNLTGRYLVAAADCPDWVIQQYGGVKVTVSGTWIATNAGQWTAAFEALRSGAIGSGAGNFGSLTGPYLSWTARGFSFQGVLLTTRFATATTVYKDPKYVFETPPAGMADFFREAQNWVPWEGSFVVVGDDVSGTNLLGRAINVIGSHKDCATMATTVKSLTYDLMRKRATWALGAPARLDFKTAVGRVQTSPADNIVQV